MSNAGAPPAGRGRGDLRRAQLVRAGVEVLAERGWAGMTARGVAGRAGAQLGLIHYHFGGFPQLKQAVARAVVDDAFRPVVDAVIRSARWQDGLADAVLAGADHRETAAGRLAAHLVTAALQDPDVRVQLAHALRDAREEVAAVLRDRDVPPDDARGLATVAVAMLDGLLLHGLVDDSLDLAAAARAARRLRTADAEPPGQRVDGPGR